MPHAIRLRLPTLATLAFMTLCGANANAQGDAEPTNDLPNPYQTIAPWGKLPAGRTWGALNGVAIDNDGESVWVVNRCGANPDIPPGASPFLYDKRIKQTLLIATALTHHLEALLNALQDQTLHANNDSMISGVFQHNRSSPEIQGFRKRTFRPATSIPSCAYRERRQRPISGRPRRVSSLLPRACSGRHRVTIARLSDARTLTPQTYTSSPSN
jgi:hypothetical protein